MSNIEIPMLVKSSYFRKLTLKLVQNTNTNQQNSEVQNSTNIPTVFQTDALELLIHN